MHQLTNHFSGKDFTPISQSHNPINHPVAGFVSNRHLSRKREANTHPIFQPAQQIHPQTKLEKGFAHPTTLDNFLQRNTRHPLPRLTTKLLLHSPREPNPETKNLFLTRINIPDAVKLKPGILSEAVIKGLSYLAIHPIAIMQTRSISAGLNVPSPSLMFPLRATFSCALHELFEYALAVHLTQKIDSVVKQLLCKHNCNENLITPNICGADIKSKYHYLLTVAINFISAFSTAIPSLAWDRINQQLILGKNLHQALESITGKPINEIQKHPGLIKEFFRGLPIAVICISAYLLVHEQSKQPIDNSGLENDISIDKQTIETSQSSFWAAIHMAFLGFLGGIIQATISTSQIHSLSTAETLVRHINRPLTPLAYGALGAVSLGFLEFAIKALTPSITKKK